MKHNLDKFLEEWEHIIKTREPVLCAIWDGGLKTCRDYTVAFTIKEGHETAGNPGHARMTAKAAAKWYKDKIHIVDMWSSGWFDFIDGGDEIVDAAKQITCYNFSWHSSGGQVLYRLLPQLAAHDTIVTCPTDRKSSWPEWYHIKSDPTNLLVSHAVANGEFRGYYHPDIPAIGVEATSASQSCAVLAGAACLLKLLKPEANHREIISALFEGADQITIKVKEKTLSDGTKEPVMEKIPWLNVYRAGQILLNGETPEPTEEEPEPMPKEPEPKQIQLTPWGEVHNFSKSPPAEDISELLGDDPLKKYLSFANHAHIRYELNEEVTLTHLLIHGANDTAKYQSREAVRLTINEREVVLPKHLEHGERRVVLFTPIHGKVFDVKVYAKSGNIVQFGPLVFPDMSDTRFEVPGPAPEPEPEPTPVKAKLVLTEPDGSVRTFIETE